MRLFKVLYPLAAVTVDVHERQAEDFDEIELIVLRLIGAGIQRIDWLGGLLGIGERHAAQFVHLLIGYSHVEETALGVLRLTELGRESLARGRRLSETVARQTLLCDAISGRPLPRNLYEAMHKLTDNITPLDRNAALPIPNMEFDRSILDEIQNDPERHYVNVVDEVTKLGKIHHVELSFFPGWMMEFGRPGEPLKYRFFTTLRVPFDDIPEKVVRSIVNEPLPDGNAMARMLQNEQHVEAYAWTQGGKGLALKVRADLELHRIGWLLPILGRDAASAHPHTPLDGLAAHGILTYYWTDSDELLLQAGRRQALNRLRDLESKRRLTVEIIPQVCDEVSKRLGVTIHSGELQEDVRDDDSERLKRLLWQLRDRNVDDAEGDPEFAEDGEFPEGEVDPH